jgi:hypothetical protein
LNASSSSVDKYLATLTEANWNKKKETKDLIKFITIGAYIRSIYPVGSDTSTYWLNMIDKLNKMTTLNQLKEIWKQAAVVRKK